MNPCDIRARDRRERQSPEPREDVEAQRELVGARGRCLLLHERVLAHIALCELREREHFTPGFALRRGIGAGGDLAEHLAREPPCRIGRERAVPAERVAPRAPVRVSVLHDVRAHSRGLHAHAEARESVVPDEFLALARLDRVDHGFVRVAMRFLAFRASAATCSITTVATKSAGEARGKQLEAKSRLSPRTPSERRILGFSRDFAHLEQRAAIRRTASQPT
jgi:hypothetical protein